MARAQEVIAGRYRLTRQIGRGGMGVVWLAQDTSLGRDVAIKFLAESLGEVDPTAEERFNREAMLAARMSHPHIVRLYDWVRDADRDAIVMEYVNGENLEQVVQRGGPLGESVVARIGAQVADALAYAHTAEVLHRDVKPANILIDHRRHALLADFGVARRSTATSGLTGTGQFLGTMRYLPPEIALGQRPSPASDVYSLAATLFMAVEGRAPHDADTDHDSTAALLLRLVSGTPRAFTLTDRLRPTLTLALAADPATRPTASELAVELSRYAGQPRVVESPQAPVSQAVAARAEPVEPAHNQTTTPLGPNAARTVVRAAPPPSGIHVGERASTIRSPRAATPRRIAPKTSGPASGTPTRRTRRGQRAAVIVLGALFVVLGLVGVWAYQESTDGLRNIAVGDCVNYFPYETVINPPDGQRRVVSCAGGSATLKVVAQPLTSNAADSCQSGLSFGWSGTSPFVTCYQVFPHINECIPEWRDRASGHIVGSLSLPFSCGAEQAPFGVGTDGRSDSADFGTTRVIAVIDRGGRCPGGSRFYDVPELNEYVCMAAFDDQ